ncbi:MAG: malto-oligosyltrehalose trehalohydrolase [Actinomycetaceae bacterium]|nr:malto-oligosyltrehalose trehalohydrolase [Actinomycetaceae bacterium]
MPNIRIWAPDAQKVELELANGEMVSTTPDGNGYFTAQLAVGTRYYVRIDGGIRLPDPRSMRQPEGPHGPSEVVDPAGFQFTVADWRGEDVAGKVFYELHIGTFTPAGTFRAAIDKLDYLRDLGVKVVELLPINPMPGTRGWGYDSVSIFALHEEYGTPQDLVAFVDACHERGLSVCLDIVYNHFGPDGNYLAQFGPYFTDRHHTPWGEAVNLDGPGSAEVRQYLIDNALQWLRDYRMDALRLDATDHLIDTGPVHFLAELSDAVAQLGSQLGRQLTITAESDFNDPATITPVAAGGKGMDMQWTDDVHHALHVWLTGEDYGYYLDHTAPDTLHNAFTKGFTRVGQDLEFEGEPKGKPLPDSYCGHHLIVCDENHDQVGNRVIGDRPSHRLALGEVAISRALILLSHYTPMLFMGEEWAASTPFMFFTDHGPDIGPHILEGRKKEFSYWDLDAIYGKPVQLVDPQAEEAFTRSKLDWEERNTGAHAKMLAFVRELISLRHEIPDLASGDRSNTEFHLASDRRSGWMRRGHILVVFNRAESGGYVPAPLNEHQLLTSFDPVTLDSSGVNFTGPSVAVLG